MQFRHAFYTSLLLGLAAAPCFAGQYPAKQAEAAEDEGVAATPVDLARLLGPDGLEALPIDNYFTGSDGGMVEHSFAYVDGDHVVFGFENVNLPDGKVLTRETFTYTAEGAFIERSVDRDVPGDIVGNKLSEVAVRDGDVIRTSRVVTLPGQLPELQKLVFDYSPPANAIPDHWLGLALAHHIREGDFEFQLRVYQFYSATEGSSEVEVSNVQNVGTETIEFGGEEHEAHVMMVTSVSIEGDAGERYECELRELMYVLEDGRIIRWDFDEPGYDTRRVVAVTAEQFEQMIEEDE